MTKRIVLCADDFGQALTISQGIAALIQANRLTATSCLVTSPEWFLHAKLLIPYKSKIDIGLHFNLTEGLPLSSAFKEKYGMYFPSLPILMQKAFFRRLDQAILQAECEAQLDRFVEAMGCLPDFIDGHQHIHQFPLVREALLGVYEARLRDAKPYIRLINEKIGFSEGLNIKKWIIYASGAKVFKNLLDKHHIPYNASFAGIYSFGKAKHFSRLFPRFLKESRDRGLIMCHPGLSSINATDDAIAHARYEEYQYLSSEQFERDCKRYDVHLGRFSEQ